MQETDWLFWGIAFLFYLPLHIGAPLLFILLSGDIERLKQAKQKLIIHGAGSAVVAFGIAIAAWPYSRLAAALVIIVATFSPWLVLRKVPKSEG